MKVITLSNRKGGCGKTTSAINIACGLARKKKRVLLLDMEDQANSTTCFLGRTPERTLLEVFHGEVGLKDIVLPTYLPNLDLAPSEEAISGINIELAGVHGREQILRKALEVAALDYDYCVIDTPPSLTLLTVNALICSDCIIVPMNFERLSFNLQGIKLLDDTLNVLGQNLNRPELRIGAILITMYNSRLNITKEHEEAVREYFQDRVLKTIIPIDVKIDEANTNRKSIYEYAPKSRGAKAYAKLIQEVIKYVKEEKQDTKDQVQSAAG